MNDLKKNKLQRRAKRLYALCITPAFAAAGSAPPGVVNNLPDFIFSRITGA